MTDHSPTEKHPDTYSPPSPEPHTPHPTPHALTRADVIVLLIAMTFPTLGGWLYFVVFAESALIKWVYGASKAVQFGLPVVWLFLVRKQPFKIAWKNTKGIGIGLQFGVLVLAAMLCSYYMFLKDSDYLFGTADQVWKKIEEIGTTTPMQFLGLAVFICVMHAFLEEYYWRWFVFGQLRRSISVFAAMVFSSIAFAAHHVIILSVYIQPEHFWTATLFFSSCIAVGGAVWAWIYQRSGSLYGPWLSHLFVDAGLMILGFDLCREYWLW